MRFSAAILSLSGLAGLVCPSAPAAEHVTLRNGFELDCVRLETAGDRVRFYFAGSANAGEANYQEVLASSVMRVETMPDPPKPTSAKLRMPHELVTPASAAKADAPTNAEMHQMLAKAGAQHHLDEDLLASVVKAESGGRVLAVSRSGARGLMQLMPGTATTLGVADSFNADQNIGGGTAYLDQLLTRYHENVGMALAAYNAGPGAVDRWHGIPPYHETRAYVARVIREFNRRKQTMTATASMAATMLATK